MQTDEQSKLLQQYLAVVPAMQEFLLALNTAQLDFRPNLDGAWTIREHAVHMAEAEYAAAMRIRKALTEPAGSRPVDVYDENAWCAAGYAHARLEHVFMVMQGVRELTAVLLQQAMAQNWKTLVIDHPIRGTLSLIDILTIYIGHWSSHRSYMERNLGLMT